VQRGNCAGREKEAEKGEGGRRARRGRKQGGCPTKKYIFWRRFSRPDLPRRTGRSRRKKRRRRKMLERPYVATGGVQVQLMSR